MATTIKQDARLKRIDLIVPKDENADAQLGATIVFLGSLFGLNFLWKLPIVDSVKANPGHTGLLILSYFAIGVVWSIVKWYFYVHNKMVKYNEFKAKFLRNNKTDGMTPELAAKFMDHLVNNYDARTEGIDGKRQPHANTKQH